MAVFGDWVGSEIELELEFGKNKIGIFVVASIGITWAVDNFFRQNFCLRFQRVERSFFDGHTAAKNQ